MTAARVRPLSDGRVERLEARRLAARPWEWRKRALASPFTPGVKLAAIAIAEFINRDSGVAWPTWGTVARSCGLSERQIRNGFAVMKEAGFFVVRRRRFRDANEIELALPPSQPGTAMPDCDPPKAARTRRSNRHVDATETGTPMPPNLLSEPSKEPSLQVDDAKEGEALVRRVTGQRCASALIGTSAALLLGYGPSDRMEGQYLDAWILSRVPPAVLNELEARCNAGALSEHALLAVLGKLGVPAREPLSS